VNCGDSLQVAATIGGCLQLIKTMGIAASLPQLPIATRSAGAAVVPDAAFDTRWAAWVERGRVHEQRVRRRFLICVPVIAIGAAIAFALL
jgi:hypothetical protein